MGSGRREGAAEGEGRWEGRQAGGGSWEIQGSTVTGKFESIDSIVDAIRSLFGWNMTVEILSRTPVMGAARAQPSTELALGFEDQRSGRFQEAHRR